MGMTAQQVVDKWARNAAGAGESFKAGVNAVQTAPTQLAAQAADRYLTGIQNAVASGRWQQGLNRVTLESWKDAMIAKALPRIATGVNAAKPKMAEFMDRWLPYQEQLRSRIRTMPKGTLADSQARAAFAIQFNAAFSKRLG